MGQTGLAAHVEREIAVEASVDPRTIRKLLAGRRVLGLPAERIRRALEARGLGHLVPTEAK